jgi:transposase
MTTFATVAQAPIVGGIDAHKDKHHVVALDLQGVLLDNREFPATTCGYRELVGWLTTLGPVDRVGVESTGSYAAGLTRYLEMQHVRVLEVNTPHRHTRARKGKDDFIDAEAAARKVLSGDANALPKVTTGAIESIRMLRIARESAVKARSAALVQLQSVLITAPAELRESITAKGVRGKATQCASFRPDLTRVDEPLQAAKVTLRSLSRRITFLNEEVHEIDHQLDGLVANAAPTLLSQLGIGTQNAAQLLITAGENIDRLSSEAAFARLCGVAPIPASSGKTQRMRLHRGGDRQANRALHLIVVCRLRHDQRSRDYMDRRRAEGLSKKDVIRCLKRFVAREVFRDLTKDLLSK